MSIVVIDTDVMINLFEQLYSGNRNDFHKAISYFQTKFISIWIPREVRREFTIRPAKSKRLYRIIKKYDDFIRMCPITTSRHERDVIINGIDNGEADAIIQMGKAISINKYHKHTFQFLSHDKKALNFAEESGFSIYRYSDLKEELNEIGIVI